MCDFTGNLVAFLDGETPPEDAERTRLHVEGCSECQGRVDAYRRATLELVEFCDDQLALESRRASYSWAAKISAVAAVAAIVTLFVVASRSRQGRHPTLEEPALSATPSASAGPLPLPVHRIEGVRRKQQVVAAPHQIQAARNHRDRRENAYSPPYEPVIEIAIPAEEMFPPGAVPAGMGFAADMSIAGDGSPDRLRLRPRLLGFERGTPIP